MRDDGFEIGLAGTGQTRLAGQRRLVRQIKVSLQEVIPRDAVYNACLIAAFDFACLLAIKGKGD